MAESCRLCPILKKRVGNKIIEKPSQLYKELYAYTNDYHLSWDAWAISQSPTYREKHKDVLKYDDMGDATFQSVIDAMGIRDEYNRNKGIDTVKREYGFDKKVYSNPDEAGNDMDVFNKQEKRHVAKVYKTDGGYKVDVSERDGISVESARSQSYSRALTHEIIELLRSMGYDVAFLDNPAYNGIFDPQNATFRDGLMTVIRIARGELGEEALPEEFAHLIIEGIQNQPLGQRLLNSLTDEEIHEILGDSYDRYSELYNGDMFRLRKEAAGKLLGQYIAKRGTIRQQTVTKKRSLLQRIWDWAKKIFGGITDSMLEKAESDAYKAVDEIYNTITSGAIIPVFDKSLVETGKSLYQLNEKIETIEDLAHRARGFEIKSIGINPDWRTRKDSKTVLEMINDKLEGEQYVGAILDFLKDTNKQLTDIYDGFEFIQDTTKEFSQATIVTYKSQAKNLRRFGTYIDGYSDYINHLQTMGDPDMYTKYGLSENEGRAIAEAAREVGAILTKMQVERQKSMLNLLAAGFRTMYQEDKVQGIGKNRNTVMCLMTLLDHASRDISLVDAVFSSLADTDDELLTMVDGIVKNQYYARDMIMIDIENEIKLADKKLRDAGYKSDFMNEKDENGNNTGRIISDYDWEAFNNEKREKIKQLRQQQKEKGWTEEQYKKEYRKWLFSPNSRGESRLVRIYVSPEAEKKHQAGLKVDENEIFEYVPNLKIYNGKAGTIAKLSEAQREYYEKMMNLKRKRMTKHLHKGEYIYNTIYIEEDFITGALNGTVKNPISSTLQLFKDKYIRTASNLGFNIPDDFGDTVKEIIERESDDEKAAKEILKKFSEALDDDVLVTVSEYTIRNIIRDNRDNVKNAVKRIIEKIQEENFYIVETDFADNVINKLPVYYTRPLKDMSRLTKDFSGAMLAYCNMSVTYEKMNEVVDFLELAKDFINQRPIQQNRSGRPMQTQISILGDVYRKLITKPGESSRLAGKLNDYLMANVYEQRIHDETFTVNGKEFDYGAILKTLKNYTGMLGLGFNAFSAVNNVATGMIQQFIDACGGEFFTLKDWAFGIKEYNANIISYLSDLGSPVKKTKLGLLEQLFDPLQEYNDKLRNAGNDQSVLSKILGDGALGYIGMNAGEHFLHFTTMIAILKHTMLNDKTTGKTISLYDALEVVQDGEVYRLKLKDGVSYTKQVIDNDGEPSTNKNYGKVKRDKDGNIITKEIELKDFKDNETQAYIFRQKRKIRKVNENLNGAFSALAKTRVHRITVTALGMQFRQWMIKHYERRFARAHYDNDLDEWVEGYYITLMKFSGHLITDISHAKQRFSEREKFLSAHEIANLRRSVAEISLFAALSSVPYIMGGRLKDRARSWDEKLKKFIYLTALRAKLDVGASTINPSLISNIITVMNSPVPANNTLEKVSKIFDVTHLFDEVSRGRFKGWSVWQRDVFQLVPYVDQIHKAMYLDDSLYTPYGL